jgi:paraquat-inducible protein A
LENTGRSHGILTARQAGLVACVQCGRVHPGDATQCARCGSALFSRDNGSLQKVWAWLVAGVILYIPANVYPMLRTTSLGATSESTIVGGVVELINHHAYAIAFIVFVASVVIPVGKFIAIGYLAISIRSPSRASNHTRQVLYEAVEFIGRWSMLDVFVVAILSALVQFNFVAAVNPGIAAVSFALSVAFTMLSAQSFDSRMIWDAEELDPT